MLRTYDDGRPLPCEVSILCSWCSCPRICSQQAAPGGREIPDKILAKLGAEICGCKKQGNVNTTEESYGPEVRLGGEGERRCEAGKGEGRVGWRGEELGA